MGAGHPTKKGHIHTGLPYWERRRIKQANRQHAKDAVEYLHYECGVPIEDACKELGISYRFYLYIIGKRDKPT